MEKIAVIGAGISGLTIANILQEKGYRIVVYEKEKTPGGLIRCKRVNGSLFHICGGHVFNSKRQDVLDWFWNKLDKNDWSKADRNAVILTDDGKEIAYPIENNFYLLDKETQRLIIRDLMVICKTDNPEISNFEDFLKSRFGNTLYDLYFKPYNEKVWRRDLYKVPISWLEGKLPMPTVGDIIFNNINHIKEKQFVHSSFWYEKYDGSQFIANKLSEKLDIRFNSVIEQIDRQSDGWNILGEHFDSVVFCGNIKDLPQILNKIDLSSYEQKIKDLEYHGTTSVFCEIDANPYSWIYLPSKLYESHRIICTGNFSPSNNARGGVMTGTVEFTDYIPLDSIMDNLTKIPLHPKYLAHHYNEFTYPIQNADTRDMIASLKQELSVSHFYFTGRFADWEYYNMDVAIGAAIDLSKQWK